MPVANSHQKRDKKWMEEKCRRGVDHNLTGIESRDEYFMTVLKIKSVLFIRALRFSQFFAVFLWTTLIFC